MTIRAGMRLVHNTAHDDPYALLVHVVRYGPVPYAEVSTQPDGARRPVLLTDLEREFPDAAEPAAAGDPAGRPPAAPDPVDIPAAGGGTGYVVPLRRGTRKAARAVPRGKRIR